MSEVFGDLNEDDFGPVNLNGVAPDVLPRQQLFFLAFQDENLRITKIRFGSNYDTLWRMGCDEAKNFGGFWTIFNSKGNFVDGNVVAR